MLKKVLPKKLLLLLFLLYFISITKCDEYDVDYTEIDLNKYNKPISAKGLHNYYEITNIKISKKYLKISTIVSDQLYPAIIAFHKAKISRQEDATLLEDKQYGNIALYIPKELIVDKKAYLNITCYVSYNPFSIEIEETDYIEIGRDESYSFYTNKNNVKNYFKISRNNTDSQSGGVGDEKSIMTFFVNGNNNIDVSIVYVKNGKESSFSEKFVDTPHGKIITFDETKYEYDEDNYYLVTIESKVGDFLIFGSRSIGDKILQFDRVNLIIPNSRAVDGYINPKYLKRECFNIEPFESSKSDKDYFIINIISYTNNIKYFFIDQNSGKIDTDFEQGNIYDEIAIKLFYKDEAKRYFCISSINENEEVKYNVQVTDFFRQINRPDIYSPQMGGYIYTRYVPAGKIVYFTHARREKFKNLNFNMKTISGIPKMYFVYCNSFPDCNYNKQLLEDEKNTKVIGRPHDVNGMFTYSLINLETNFKYIDNEQYLMVVACNGNKDCVFETSIFSDNDVQLLKDSSKYYQYAMEGDEDQYKFTITDKLKSSIYINLQTFSGDTEFIMNDKDMPKNIKKRVFYASNKEIYEFYPAKSGVTLEGEYKFSIKGVLNSYYVVDYTTFQNDVYLDSGIMTLETMRYKDSVKHIYIKNKRVNETQGLVTNFFSLNCIITVLRVNKNDRVIDVPRNAYYLQDAITPEDEIYSDLIYHYMVTVQKIDSLYYDDDEKCLFYVNALEMDSDIEHKDYKDRQIVVPENIQMNVNLNSRIRGIKYLYPHSAKTGNILLDINLSDENPLEVWISFESSLTIHKYNIGRSRNIVIPENNFRTNATEEKAPCPNNKEVCNVIIEITSKDNERLAEGIDIELSIKSNETIPVYVRKGLLREDIVTGDRIQYYFTDIKQGEKGDIYVNFNRGSGLVWAKLLPKTEESSEEQYAWMGKYKLPLEDDEENLYYDSYTKMLSYTSDQTQVCEIGCYLVIGVKNNLKELVGSQEFFVYEVSVMIRNKKDDVTQVINVPADEYIVGNIPFNSVKSYYNYYSFYVPATSKKLLIEFQSQMCNVLVNEGEKKPTDEEYDYIFLSRGKNTIFEINISDDHFIGRNLQSLKGLNFTIAVGAEDFDSIYTSLYTMKFRTPKADFPEIIQTNSDQNTLCYSKKEDNSNLCYFVIDIRVWNTIQNIYLHAYGEHGSKVKAMAANLVEGEVFDKWESSETIRELLPKPGQGQFNAEEYEPDHLLVPFIETHNDQYLLITVETDVDTIVTFLSTFYTYVKEIFPNPSTNTLFYLDRQERINFTFPNNQNYLVHVVSVDNNGYVKIGEDYSHYIRANHDEFALALNDELDVSVTTTEKEGFGFYVYYENRPTENFDMVEFGKTQTMYYEKTDFPLIFYSEIPKDIIENKNDVDIIVNFKNFSYIDDIYDTDDNDLFQISALITDKTTILEKKRNRRINPGLKGDVILGKYDLSVRVGKVHIDYKQIEEYDAHNDDKFLYIVVAKRSTNLYKKIINEISIYSSNSVTKSAPTQQYIFGSLTKEKPLNKFLIKKDEFEDKIVNLEFSTNGDVTFAVNPYSNKDNEKELYNNNTAFVSQKFVGGKVIVEFSCSTEEKSTSNEDGFILSIFPSNKKHEVKEVKLSNYIFKYVSSVEPLPDYSVKNNKIEFELDKENTLHLFVAPLLKGNNFIPATYFTKIIKKSEDNLKENLNTIGFTETKTFVVYKDGIWNEESKKYIERNGNKYVHISIYNYKKDLPYILSVIAMSNEQNREYYSYSLLDNPLNVKLSTGMSGGTIALIVILIFIVIGVIGLIAFVYFKMKKANAELRQKVESISFAGENKDDLLLGKSSDTVF